MNKTQNEKHSKKIRKLVTFCSLCAIILSVSTYAWFIGMKTVNIAKFEINIATTEGLYLSMDGKNWSYTLSAKEVPAYTNNTNKWADGENEGLIPMSTVGDMDSDVSRMKLYEKGSLTAVTGGYRLLSTRVHNYDTDNGHGQMVEGKGYVVFDLFVKNLSGPAYYPTNDVLNEEAIYLTTNSQVTVSDNGGVANTGIENSMRVAFTQIGRVKGDVTFADTTEEDAYVSTITGITCASTQDEDDNPIITGICRNAQIWEPNDKKHVQNAINWYEESCIKRVTAGSTVTAKASYSFDETSGAPIACNTLTLTDAYKTYAISRTIVVGDNVNIYDGADYNGYAANTIDYATYAAANAETKETYKLVSYPYFTDTQKNIAGATRPQFMTLAPNSITKLRVYVYLEGQDIDNYDFASLGKKISVNFGFTKERYSESDYPNYDGPSTNITSDTTTTTTTVAG